MAAQADFNGLSPFEKPIVTDTYRNTLGEIDAAGDSVVAKVRNAQVDIENATNQKRISDAVKEATAPYRPAVPKGRIPTRTDGVFGVLLADSKPHIKNQIPESPAKKPGLLSRIFTGKQQKL